MPLVTPEEVRAVIDTVPDSVDLATFIETANLIITEQITDATISAARLRQIELYLSAHFVAITRERGGLTSDETGESKAEFSDVYEAGFALTRFGQAAMQLDTSGVLKAINEDANTKVARFTVV